MVGADVVGTGHSGGSGTEHNFCYDDLSPVFVQLCHHIHPSLLDMKKGAWGTLSSENVYISITGSVMNEVIKTFGQRSCAVNVWVKEIW